MEKMNRFLEMFWAGLTVITAILAIYLLVVDGYEQTKFLLMIPFITAAVWIMRRSLRLRLEKNQKEARKKKNNN
jgi:hypothetical protein